MGGLRRRHYPRGITAATQTNHGGAVGRFYQSSNARLRLPKGPVLVKDPFTELGERRPDVADPAAPVSIEIRHVNLKCVSRIAGRVTLRQCQLPGARVGVLQ